MSQLILWSQKEFDGRDRKLKGLVKRLKQAKEGGDQYKKGNEIGKIKKKIQGMLTDKEVY